MKSKTFTRITKVLLLAVLFLLVGVRGWGQTSITAIGTPVSQNFDGLNLAGEWTDNSTLTGWYVRTTNTSSIIDYNESDGNTIAVGLYSFGVTGTNTNDDRSLGWVPGTDFTGPEGSGEGYIGWRLKNNTGKSIATIQVKWSGEQWKKISAQAQNLVLNYQIGNTVENLTSGTFTPAGSVFNSPIYGVLGDELVLDGNASENRSSDITIELNVTIPIGQEIMLRWDDVMDPANHLMAIDDVSFTALKESQTITFDALLPRNYVNNETFTLTATASSNLSVSYTSSNSGVVSISGTTATVHASGQAIITASQSGNSNFAPALDVTQVQIIVPAAPVAIAATSITGTSYAANWNASLGGAEEYWYYTSTDNFATTSVTGSAGSSLTVSISGLFPNTTYYYRVRAKAGTEYSNYSNIITITTGAGVQTYNIIAQTPSGGNGFTSQKLTWSNGNLTGRILFMREGTGDPCPNPTDLTNYTASTNWASKGTQLGTSGFFCIYKSTSTAVTLTNLYPGRTYTVQAFEYTGSGITSKFLTTVSGSNNPITYTPWLTTTFTNTTSGQATAEDWTTAARWDHATVPTAALHTAVLVYIDGNCEVTTDVAANNLTIKAAHSGINPKLAINSDKSLTITGTLTNNAGTSGIILKSTSAGTGSLIHYTANVDATIERYITGGTVTVPGPPIKQVPLYHQVSVPLSSQENYSSPGNYESSIWTHSYLFTYDATSNNWDNWDYQTNDPCPFNKGYLIYHPDWKPGISQPDTIYIMKGKLNIGSYSPPVTNGGNGFNLIPNPYPSSINWNASSGWSFNNMSSGIWLYNATTNNYATVVRTGSGTIASGTLTTSAIQVGQAFFVKATGSSPTISMNDNVRIHNSSQGFLKNSDAIANSLRLNIQGNSSADEILVNFAFDATTGYDSHYDAEKFTGPETSPQLSALNPSSDKYSIIGLPLSSDETVLPLNLNMNYSGELTFTASQLESFTTGTSIKLEDKQLAKTIDLRSTPAYSFTHTPDDADDRFVLHFGSVLGFDDNHALLTSSVTVNGKQISVSYPTTSAKHLSASIFDTQGRLLKQVSLNGTGNDSFTLSETSGVYLLRLTLPGGNETHKIVVL